MEIQRSEQGILILDIPVPHKGYVDLLKKHANGSIETLYLVGEDILTDLGLRKEIRANNSETTLKMLTGLNFPFDIQVLGLDRINELKSRRIYTIRDDVSRRLRKGYFPDAQVTEETPFLRWDESNVTSSRPALIDEETTDPFHIWMMKRARELSEESSDWWRQVGAVIVKRSQIITHGYNMGQPSDQTPYIDGNPRDFVQAGTLPFLVGTIHAEQLSIAKSAKLGLPLLGADIYVTVFPCPPCASSIGFAGISRCFWAGGNAYLEAAEVLQTAGVKSIFVNESQPIGK